MNKLFTVLGGKFKFSAQDSDLEYLFLRSKNSLVSYDLKPPLEISSVDNQRSKYLAEIQGFHYLAFGFGRRSLILKIQPLVLS